MKSLLWAYVFLAVCGSTTGSELLDSLQPWAWGTSLSEVQRHMPLKKITEAHMPLQEIPGDSIRRFDLYLSSIKHLGGANVRHILSFDKDSLSGVLIYPESTLDVFRLGNSLIAELGDPADAVHSRENVSYFWVVNETYIVWNFATGPEQSFVSLTRKDRILEMAAQVRHGSDNSSGIGVAITLLFWLCWVIGIPVAAYNLATDKGYPSPKWWAFCSLLSAWPLIYLIFRKPYRKRHSAFLEAP